ncbi:MAG: peptidyl-tRNA hydrolase Pth2 [Candidatus Aenigmarchaeota archaeon]|nr:peptidyl-tRNA hydrolase Pth2 [Candidatus Aenigmarchaeota archaeon]
MYKQVIILRSDIEMGIGKKCVQCSHASLGAYKKADKKIVKKWESEGQKKVVLKVNSKKDLLEYFNRVKKEKIPCFLVKDAGLTELRPRTITALGIGPEEEEKLDKITGKLKLL